MTRRATEKKLRSAARKGAAARRIPTRGKTRRGAVLLEAALVLWILLMLTFGLVEFAHFYFTQHNLTGAAREGARAGIPAGASNADITQAVTNTMSASGFSSDSYTMSISPDAGTAAQGTEINVTVSSTWGSVGIRPLGLIGADRQVVGVAVMQKE